MWMTRQEIAEALGIVPNSVRGKVQKGQIERKVEGGKNYYRIAGPQPVRRERKGRRKRDTAAPPPGLPVEHETIERGSETTSEPVKPIPKSGVFNPKQVLLEQLASLKLERNIDAIEKGDEIDLATGEISRELDAKITMRQHKQLKEIEDALERLKHGEYGICEECGEPIPEQRLRLFPAARLCVRCQEEYDQLEKLKEAQGLRGGAWREETSEGNYARFED